VLRIEIKKVGDSRQPKNFAVFLLEEGALAEFAPGVAWRANGNVTVARAFGENSDISHYGGHISYGRASYGHVSHGPIPCTVDTSCSLGGL